MTSHIKSMPEPFHNDACCACEGHLMTTLRATAFGKSLGEPVRSACCVPDVTRGCYTGGAGRKARSPCAESRHHSRRTHNEKPPQAEAVLRGVFTRLHRTGYLLTMSRSQILYLILVYNLQKVAQSISHPSLITSF